ncbi:hypothetical protein K3495_g1373 [Podosphaera aphanis]|nr:hypothetical protein K3495_g1373 [Podosphaera aphanis]
MSLTGVSHKNQKQAVSSAVPSIFEASSLDAIRTTLSALHSRDAVITSRLKALISLQTDLSRELGRLDLLRAHVGVQVVHTRKICNNSLNAAAGTAAHLSSNVKELDLEKKHVEETLRVVELVVELKACIQGVVGSMGAPQDWDAAAGYISRASKVPKRIVDGEFAARILPSVEVPDPPGLTLESAKDSLCGLFTREFEKAADEGDGSKVTRFFKLFPLIGKEKTGLEVYGKYVCRGVAARARESLRDDTKGKHGFFYANALTQLFEHIAQIIEGHGGLVERYYGKGMMIKVIERIQMETDVQGGIILDMWADERSIDRKLTDVKSYPFSFLVQSFLPGQKNMGISRTNSPAFGGNNNALRQDEVVDMKVVDEILSETAIMLGRWSLYSRFVSGKCRNPEALSEEPHVLPELLVKSSLNRKVSSQLITSFNVMTTFFFRRSVEKAFQLDESPSGLTLHPNKPIDSNPPHVASAVDDVMYIVNTVLERSISTSQREIITSTILTIGRVLGSDFIGMIQRKMRDESYPKPQIQGGFPPEEKIIAFIVLINSLEVASEYITRIVTSFLARSEALPDSTTKNPINERFPFDRDAEVVTTSLESLRSTFVSQTFELHSDGLHVIFNQVVKLRLRPVLADVFRDVDYSLSEDDLAEIMQEKGDINSFHGLVSQRFEYGWDALMKPIQRIMGPNSYSALLEQTAKHLARVLEKRIWGLSGKMNALGAQRLEKDFSGIIRVVARGGRYSVRDLFSRISQICMLANMEDEEWEAVTALDNDSEEKMVWVLSAPERPKARNLVQR